MLSLGASSLLGPPGDLSTVEELQDRLRRLPLHPPTKVSFWPCTVAAAEVVPSTGRSLQTLRPQPHSSHSRCRFGCSPKIPTKNKRPLVDGFVSGGKVIFLFPFRLRRLLNRYRLRSSPSSDCPRRCPLLCRYRHLGRRVFLASCASLIASTIDFLPLMKSLIMLFLSDGSTPISSLKRVAVLFSHLIRSSAHCRGMPAIFIFSKWSSN